MSRTDAHRPYAVVLADHPELVRERHDHRATGCPLDEGRPLSDDPSSPCSIGLPQWAWLCNCPKCSGSYWRRAAAGARRSAERILTRAAARGGTQEELERLENTLHHRSR